MVTAEAASHWEIAKNKVFDAKKLPAWCASSFGKNPVLICLEKQALMGKQYKSLWSVNLSTLST